MRLIIAAARIVGCLCAFIALDACEHYELSDRTLVMNEAVSDADNRQVLLNIARASRRYPTAFTSTTGINTTGIADSSTLGLSLPFGPKNGNVYSLTPSLKLQEGLTITTAPLDTQAFFQGYLAPLPTSLVGYYLDNAWTPQLIYDVFFQEVDIPADLLNRIKNEVAKTCMGDHPPSPMSVRCLARVRDTAEINGQRVRCTGPVGQLPPQCIVWQVDEDALQRCPELGELLQYSPVVNSPNVPPVNQSTNSEKFVNAVSPGGGNCIFHRFEYFMAMLEKLNLRVQSSAPSGPGTNVTVPTTDQNISIKLQTGNTADPTYGFNIDGVLQACNAPQKPKPAPKPKPPTTAGPSASTTPAARTPRPPAHPAPPVQQSSHLALLNNSDPGANTLPPECKEAQQTHFKIRSPEGVLFYLGSVMNAEDPSNPASHGFVLTFRNPNYGDPLTLFAVNHAADPNAAINVTLDGDEYSVPRVKPESTDHTMHVISLTEQLIALQKAGTKEPSVPVVQLIGQ